MWFSWLSDAGGIFFFGFLHRDVAGGFTSIPWTSAQTYVADVHAFLFRVRSAHGYQSCKLARVGGNEVDISRGSNVCCLR